MDMSVMLILVIIAGGMFGVILGKFLDSTPNWVFWFIVILFFILTMLVLTQAV